MAAARFKLDFSLAELEAESSVLASLRPGNALVLRHDAPPHPPAPIATSPDAATTSASATEAAAAAVPDGSSDAMQGIEEQAQQPAEASNTAAASSETDGAPETAASAPPPTQPPEQPAAPLGPAPAPPAAARLCVYTSEGVALGALPPQLATRLRQAGLDRLRVTVRSIKKVLDGGVEQLLLRVEEAPPARAARGGSSAPPAGGYGYDATVEPDPTGFQLSRTQLEALAHCVPVRAALKDERLQALLARIDGSKHAEKLLEHTLATDPAFETFAAQMLEAVKPEFVGRWGV